MHLTPHANTHMERESKKGTEGTDARGGGGGGGGERERERERESFGMHVKTKSPPCRPEWRGRGKKQTERGSNLDHDRGLKLIGFWISDTLGTPEVSACLTKRANGQIGRRGRGRRGGEWMKGVRRGQRENRKETGGGSGWRWGRGGLQGGGGGDGACETWRSDVSCFESHWTAGQVGGQLPREAPRGLEPIT